MSKQVVAGIQNKQQQVLEWEEGKVKKKQQQELIFFEGMLCGQCYILLWSGGRLDAWIQ